MGMTIDDIKTKVGRRVGDPLCETYPDAILDYFEQAFTTLLRKTGDKDLIPIYLNEISPSIKIKEKTITPNSLYYNEITIDKTNFPNLMKIFEIDNNALDSRIKKVFTYLDINSFNLIVKNTVVTPPTIQGYWTSDGNVIKIYINETITVRVKYIENPITSDWGDQDLVSDIGYGYGFIIDCIELASSLLKRQIGIEG